MAASKIHPSIRDLISLNIPVKAKINEAGDKVAYTKRETNWNQNSYENKLFVYHDSSGDSCQINRIGDVTDFYWIGDSGIFALSLSEDDAQVLMYENLMGEPLRLTHHETKIQAFKPANNGVLFLADHPEKSKRKELRYEYGAVTHFEEEESASALYYTEPSAVKKYNKMVMQVIEDEAKEIPKPVIEVSRYLTPMKIIDFFYCDNRVYLNCRRKDPLVYHKQVSSHVIEINLSQALENHMQDVEWSAQSTQINLPEQANIAAVNPSDSSLLISYKERDRLSYTQADLWHFEPRGDLTEPQLPKMRMVTGNLDRSIMHVEWGDSGLYVSYVDGTSTRYAEVTLDGDINPIDLGDVHGDLDFQVSKSGFLAFTGANHETINEVFFTQSPITSTPKLRQATNCNSQIENWEMGKVETIEWTSKDGTKIQGILRKPGNYDPKKKYPLLFDVHGGPSWYSREVLLEPYDYQRYPVVQFNNLDVLILKPNYRGSIGRGQGFRELNVDNLGVGDLWDLESAIDHLDSQGVIDTDNVGCMGWSQGGYISAFAGLRSNRFKAVSVGAGISDWYTYHISNDIPHFTDDYLSSSPWDDPEIYKKTAPITGIDSAKTPTLIQHGAKDMRVPISNAMEIYRALKAKNVPVELFIYPEMAHPITKPRECKAVMQQNLDWFKHYLVDPEWEPVGKNWDKY